MLSTIATALVLCLAWWSCATATIIWGPTPKAPVPGSLSSPSEVADLEDLEKNLEPPRRLWCCGARDRAPRWLGLGDVYPQNLGGLTAEQYQAAMEIDLGERESRNDAQGGQQASEAFKRDAEEESRTLTFLGLRPRGKSPGRRSTLHGPRSPMPSTVRQRSSKPPNRASTVAVYPGGHERRVSTEYEAFGDAFADRKPENVLESAETHAAAESEFPEVTIGDQRVSVSGAVLRVVSRMPRAHSPCRWRAWQE